MSTVGSTDGCEYDDPRPRTALTSSLGYFMFDDVEAGQTYVISVISKRYGFAQSSQIISVTDRITELVFTSSWQN